MLIKDFLILFSDKEWSPVSDLSAMHIRFIDVICVWKNLVFGLLL